MWNEAFTWGDYLTVELLAPILLLIGAVVLTLIGFGEKKFKHCPECNADLTMHEPHWKGCGKSDL